MLDIEDLIMIAPGGSFITNDDHTMTCCSNFTTSQQIACHDPLDLNRFLVNYHEIKEIIPDNRKIVWVGY